ncbi:MAG: hypothetical protein OEL78_05245 [Hyphomicrobiales bacterium]|nr:hypothetical protein [Hyphomicrobiales bacterium]
MAFGIKTEALVPGLTFSGLFLLVVASAMLNLYPSSEWLWWVNLAIGREMTDVFNLLDFAGMGSYSLQITLFAVLACLSIWSSGRFWLHRTFFLNHLAAMLIGLSLFGPAASNSASISGSPQTSFGWFTAMPGREDAALLILFAVSLASCAATHLLMVRRNRTN